jgi:16S rRNA processing protein RimM
LTEEFYLVGRVRRAHGIRGELVIEALTDAPDAIFAAGRRVFAGTRERDLAPDRRELRIERATPFKGGFIVSIEGITDRATADSWRDRYLLVPGDEVAPPGEDEMFIHDLVGMQVVHVGGAPVGAVIQVFQLPQGIMMEVAREGRTSVLLPFDEQTVSQVDSVARIIRIDPVPGLLD